MVKGIYNDKRRCITNDNWPILIIKALEGDQELKITRLED